MSAQAPPLQNPSKAIEEKETLFDKLVQPTRGLTLMSASNDQQRISIPNSVLTLIVGTLIWIAGLTGGLIWTAATLVAEVRNLSEAGIQRKLEDDAYRNQKLQQEQATQAYINVQLQRLAKQEAQIEELQRKVR